MNVSSLLDPYKDTILFVAVTQHSGHFETLEMTNIVANIT